MIGFTAKTEYGELAHFSITAKPFLLYVIKNSKQMTNIGYLMLLDYGRFTRRNDNKIKTNIYVSGIM